MRINKHLILCISAMTLSLHSIASDYRSRFPLPTNKVPDGLGVNIHFTDPKPGEMELLSRAGYKWVRMDFLWQNVEKERGVYDFSAYDRLTATLKKYGLRAIFILDYGNKLYQKPSGAFEHDAPSTPAAVEAFCQFVRKGVSRFKGQGIIWEIYNEPNGWFWFPNANVRDYSHLAVEVGKTIRKTAPDEWYVGPALYGYDFAFLEGCVNAGLLKYWDAVTIHPYGIGVPETAVPNWIRLQKYLKKQEPRKTIPVICGEFGYCDIDRGIGIDRQGSFAVRTYLANVYSGVGLTIWYDWNDDGSSPTEREHHFGTMTLDLKPKPTYTRVKAMHDALAGSQFIMRQAQKSPDDWILVFRDESGKGLAVGWNASDTNVSLLGLTSTPRVLNSTELDPAIVNRACNFKPLAPQVETDRAHAIIKLFRPLVENLRNGEILVLCDEKSSATVKIKRGQAGELASLVKNLPFIYDRTRANSRILADLVLPNGQQFRQICNLHNPTPVSVGFSTHGQELVVSMLTKGGDQELRCFAFTGDKPLTGNPNSRLDLRSNRIVSQTFEIDNTQMNKPFWVQLRDMNGNIVGQTDPTTLIPIDLSAATWTITLDGDQSVPASVDRRTTADSCISFDYRFNKGWRFLRIAPNQVLSGVDGSILSGLSMWIDGDASGNMARMRFMDATNQVHQVDGPIINWKGPRLVTFRFDDPSGAWGGAFDSVIHHPIRIDTFLLIDSLGKEAQGSLKISNAALLVTSGK